MPQNLMFWWRHTAHVLVGVALAWLVARYGLCIPDPVGGWADTALFGLGVAAYGYVQHCAETRRGRGWGAAAVPVYADTNQLGVPAAVAPTPPRARMFTDRPIDRPTDYPPPPGAVPP